MSIDAPHGEQGSGSGRTETRNGDIDVDRSKVFVKCDFLRGVFVSLFQASACVRGDIQRSDPFWSQWLVCSSRWYRVSPCSVQYFEFM